MPVFGVELASREFYGLVVINMLHHLKPPRRKLCYFSHQSAIWHCSEVTRLCTSPCQHRPLLARADYLRGHLTPPSSVRAVRHSAALSTPFMTRMTRFPQTSANHSHGRLFRFLVILVIFVIQRRGIDISTPRYEHRQ